ncbi:MAG: T9SS type A sorting domain-containing protein [Candidatus Coatesbacteria bacterium]|nr:T9SS type A sorting domain-containing protein [Candidatus Coatesbacteria bacterium]
MVSVICICSSALFSWEKTYDFGNRTVINSVNKCTDNGNMICGKVDSKGWYGKTDQYGTVLFNYTFGWNNDNSALYSVQCEDGGYLVAGYKIDFRNDGYHLYYVTASVLFKLNNYGYAQWEKNHLMEIEEEDKPFSELRRILKPAADKFYVIGNTGHNGSYYHKYRSKVFMAELDPDGNVFKRGYSPSDAYYFAYSGDMTFDNGMIIGGFKSYSGSQCMYMRVDSEFRVIWIKADNPGIIFGAKTGDDGYILCGRINNDAMYAKINNSGNYIWAKRITGSGFEQFNDICIESDGYVFCGYTTSYGSGGNDIILLKTDKDGNTLWTKYIGTSGSEIGNAIVADGNSYLIGGGKDVYGYLVQSEREQERFIRVISPNGGETWLTGSQHLVQWDCPDNGRVMVFYSSNGKNGNYKEIYRGQGTSKSFMWTIPDDPSNDCWVKGYWADYDYKEDISDQSFTITDQQDFDDTETTSIPSLKFSVCPSPFSNRLYLFLPYTTSVYSLSGQLIMKLDKGKHSLDTSKWKEGVYIVKSGKETKRIVKIR